MMVVITTSNGDDADTDRELGDDGGDHYPQWRGADTDSERGDSGGGEHYQQ